MHADILEENASAPPNLRKFVSSNTSYSSTRSSQQQPTTHTIVPGEEEGPRRTRQKKRVKKTQKTSTGRTRMEKK